MSVVGLDFGNLSVLIGQAGRGGVDVILNDSSNRQTASYVSIQGKQRFLGDSGAAMVSDMRRKLQRTYRMWPALIPVTSLIQWKQSSTVLDDSFDDVWQSCNDRVANSDQKRRSESSLKRETVPKPSL